MITGVRLWLLEHLPDGLLARPAEWFLAVLCMFSGFGIVSGAGRAPASERLLPWEPFYYTWGGALLIGGLAMCIGLASIKFVHEYRHIVTRPAFYRLGLRLLGSAALLYAVAILLASGTNAIMAAAITLAFVGMCVIRLLTVGSVT